jgi:transposase
MQLYSQDLRDRVLCTLYRGERPTDIAARFEVSREWVYDVKTRYEKEGLRHSLPMGGHRVSRVADKESLIRGWIK